MPLAPPSPPSPPPTRPSYYTDEDWPEEVALVIRRSDGDALLVWREPGGPEGSLIGLVGATVVGNETHEAAAARAADDTLGLPIAHAAPMLPICVTKVGDTRVFSYAVECAGAAAAPLVSRQGRPLFWLPLGAVRECPVSVTASAHAAALALQD